MDATLKKVLQELLDSEDDAGWSTGYRYYCDNGYTVVSKKPINAIRKMLEQERKEETLKDKEIKLFDLREERAQEAFENDPLDGLTCVDSEGWAIDGDSYLKKFYYENEDNPDDTSVATFVVTFKKNTSKIIDKHVNIW